MWGSAVALIDPLMPGAMKSGTGLRRYELHTPSLEIVEVKVMIRVGGCSVKRHQLPWGTEIICQPQPLGVNT